MEVAHVEACSSKEPGLNASTKRRSTSGPAAAAAAESRSGAPRRAESKTSPARSALKAATPGASASEGQTHGAAGRPDFSSLGRPLAARGASSDRGPSFELYVSGRNGGAEAEAVEGSEVPPKESRHTKYSLRDLKVASPLPHALVKTTTLKAKQSTRVIPKP